jgi:hypothetical protein
MGEDSDDTQTFEIECLCGMPLEVEDDGIVECPDCGRIYDDRGMLISKKDGEVIFIGTIRKFQLKKGLTPFLCKNTTST